MDLRNDDRHARIDPAGLARLRSLDMAVATRTSLPVLISAPAEYALPMAIEIAAGPGGAAAGDDIVVVDTADNRTLSSTLTRASAADRGPVRAIVVQDVEGLDQAQQLALMALVADTAHPGSRACRIIATTSVPLFERVIQGSFDSDLFYRLNRIHIKVAAAGSQGH